MGKGQMDWSGLGALKNRMKVYVVTMTFEH